MKKAMKFLKTYKGKNANMKIEKNLASMFEAELLVEEAHTTYMNKIKSRSSVATTGEDGSNARIKVIRR